MVQVLWHAYPVSAPWYSMLVQLCLIQPVHIGLHGQYTVKLHRTIKGSLEIKQIEKREEEEPRENDSPANLQ